MMSPTDVPIRVLLFYVLRLLKVDAFMTRAGMDTNGTRGALNGVRHISWKTGRTLQRKYLVLLAFAEV